MSASADAEPEESLPTLTREELEGVDKETVMVSSRIFSLKVTAYNNDDIIAWFVQS